MKHLDNDLFSSSLNRRDLLRAGALGVATLGVASLAPLAEALQIPTTAKNEKEYRTRLMALGSLSLKSAQMGQQKATNPALKEFATFEATEQAMIAKVLLDLGTLAAPVDPQSTQILQQHEQATGADFDRVFARAQLQVHQMLHELTQSFLQNSKGNGTAERHARHIAMISDATITEHIAHTTALVAAVGASS